MTENGDPLENALAERINGIIKDEYLQFCKPANIIEAKAILKRTVKLYNQQRPHMSIGNLTPEQIHCNINLKTEKLWKTIIIQSLTLNIQKITVNKKHIYITCKLILGRVTQSFTGLFTQSGSPSAAEC
ncbi:MAG: transposase [Chitinophagaceae bacterium]|nr:transposase [Chitinophagaceae bacterium]